MTYLSVAFASPQSVYRFVELLPNICGKLVWSLPSAQTSTLKAMSAIDQLDYDVLGVMILQRMYLAQLRQRFQ